MIDATTLTNQQIAEAAGWWVVRDHGFDEWYPPDYDANIRPGYHTDVPMYLESLDVALTLPLPTARYHWHLRGNRTGWTAEIWDGGWNETEAHAPTPAEAICRAWLAWQESQSHHKA